MLQIFAQLIGFIALFVVFISFQKEKRGSILGLLLVAQLLFVLHFALLGAWTGAVMNLISAVRSYISSKREIKGWCSHDLWLYIFIILSWISGILIWNNIFSILPIIAMTIDSHAIWNKNPKYIRLLSVIPRPMWFIYNLSVLSYPGLIAETISFLSLIIGIFRFDVEKRKK